jgi:hypothetical protein
MHLNYYGDSQQPKVHLQSADKFIIINKTVHSRSLCYKTFYDRNLQIFFVLGKPFQPSLMFVGEARSLP